MNSNVVDLLEIIKRKDIASSNGFWLEAFALAHLFIETQLNIIVSSKCSSAEVKRASRKHVWGLGNLAKNKSLITSNTWDKIEKVNINRNKTIHGLISREITYSEIENHVSEANKLITELQRYYVKVSIGPELKVDD